MRQKVRTCTTRTSDPVELLESLTHTTMILVVERVVRVVRAERVAKVERDGRIGWISSIRKIGWVERAARV